MNKLAPSNLKFGLFFSAIFLFLSIYFYFNNYLKSSFIIFFIAIILILISIVNPKLLSFLNNLWLNLGFLLGKIVSPLILVFLFFFVISPLSIFLRLIGRDELKISNHPKQSYWNYRYIQEFQPSSFKNQY